MKSNKVIQMLEYFKVNLKARDHKDYTFNANGFMPLNIETWREDGELVVSMCHYGKQNGDMMRDPEIVFKIKGDKVIPMKYLNDYVGVIQTPKSDFEKQDILQFLEEWSDTVRSRYK